MPTQHLFSNVPNLKPLENAQTTNLTSWSFSGLLTYEQCPYRMKLAKIDRIPEPEPKEDSPLVRGSIMHQIAEDYITGQRDDVSGIKHFQDDLARYRDEYQAGTCEVEGEWGYDNTWTPTDWKTAWLRMKLDVLVRKDDTAEICDWKTGRKDGNQIKHTQQGQLYAIGTFLRYPDVQNLQVSFKYLDKNATLDLNYTRNDIIRPMQQFNKRAKAMTEATTFPPKPNQHNCKWCPYGNNGNKECPFAV